MKFIMEQELILLGKRIAKLRTSRNLTQEKLAELVDRSPNHISKLELATTNPSFEVLVKIAHALNVEIADLFMFENSTKHKNAKQELEKLIASSNETTINLLYRIYCALDE